MDSLVPPRVSVFPEPELVRWFQAYGFNQRAGVPKATGPWVPLPPPWPGCLQAATRVQP